VDTTLEEEPVPAPEEPAPLVRVLTVCEPELEGELEPDVDFEPLLAVLTTGAAELAAAAPALEPGTRAPAEPAPPGPLPATWCGCARR
jgi:hypothetical protein